VPWWQRCSGHGWHRWQGPAVPEEKGEGEAHATCESRRTEDRLTEEAETQRRGGSNLWWSGGEVIRGRRGQARWGAGRQRRMERMEKKNGEKRGEVSGQWLFMVARWSGRRGKWGRGVRGSALRGGKNGEERGGPRARQGIAQRPALAPGRQARAQPLPRDRGGRRGMSDSARAVDRRVRQHSAARFIFKPIQTKSKIFQTVQSDSKFSKFY
jgi:hypothetical protein